MTAVSEPEILSVVAGEGTARLEMRVPRDLSWFEGHFPECPLLPGVIQVTWAIRFARRYLDVAAADAQRSEAFAGFGRLSKLKFMRFILPGAEIALLLEFDAKRRELSFEYREGEAVCAEGTIGLTGVS